MDTFAVIVTRRRVSLCFVTWSIAALMILIAMIIHTAAVVDGEADDSQLEAHLKRLNKPAVKTMKVNCYIFFLLLYINPCIL